MVGLGRESRELMKHVMLAREDSVNMDALDVVETEILGGETGFCPLCHSAAHNPIFEKPDSDRGHLTYWSCDVCGLVFLDCAGHLTHTLERARYDLHHNHDTPGYRDFLGRVVGPLAHHLIPGDRGLDYGSGPNSLLAVMLTEQGWPMDYYDPHFSPDRTRLRPGYDFVTCTEVAEHFRFPYQEWDFIDRVLLRPRARLAVMTSFLSEGDDFSSWWYSREPTHISFYCPKTFQWISRRWGWKILHLADNVGIFQKA